MNFRNNLLSQIKASPLAALSGSMHEVSLARMQPLYDTGERPLHLYFPGTAVTSVMTLMRGGQTVETSTIGFEGAPGLLTILADRASSSQVFAQVAGSAIRVPAGLVRDVAESDPEFMRLLLRFADGNVAHVELSAACNALHDIPSRLARWLLLTQDRIGHAAIPLTQELLAAMLGVQRTSVTQASLQLKKAGLVRYTRGNIQVLDRDGLVHAACECYGAGRTISDGLTYGE
jgi:CRP-like cAMP-binding protein